ncbi:hypothetical protein HNY73_018905 [Argiope bruennichi]|uniref:Uncharacterized protein n=1 Tax=Argiope bruennichi TaxID=94029 RepID=A0A8T0EJF7_ARGBR|nr:hypothetical protein HNY73_018905 [Argiope bruennichi]
MDEGIQELDQERVGRCPLDDEIKYMLLIWMRYSGFIVPKGTYFDHRYQIPTMKHGEGNVLFRECISCLGMGPLKSGGPMGQKN